VGVLKEYDLVHQALNAKVPDSIRSRLDAINRKFPDIPAQQQREFSAESFFANTDAPFPDFAKSRHCVRNYDPDAEIPIGDLIDAIELAKTAPSACNRQPIRVHIITKREQIDRCLALQNGNRGFGHLGNKLLIVTGKIETQLGPNEFLGVHIDGGIFIMNLVLAPCISGQSLIPTIHGKETRNESQQKRCHRLKD
jgi:hypothetical protein